MTTVEMIKEIYDFSYKYYKHSRHCVEGLKLDRHEPVEIEGHIFSYWKEYVMYKIAEYLQDKLPFATVVVTLDGNNSNVDLTCSDEEQQKLNAKMLQLIDEMKNTRF